jgi:hypothetical protein
VIERVVGSALARQRFEIAGDAAICERRAVNHRDDSVDGDATPDFRPVERLHQRFRQGQT